MVDENTIYHAYQIHQGYNNSSVGLVRLDNDLNNLWNITLSGGQSNYAYGQCLKSLQNGDVAIAFFTSGNSGDHFHLYIIHDDYDSTPEATTIDRPFSFNPNPMKDQLNLSFTEGIEPLGVEIFDLSGRLMNAKYSHLESLDMSVLPAGIYLLRVTMKDGTSYHEKIVKQ